jgi:hypothetical protein
MRAVEDIGEMHIRLLDRMARLSIQPPGWSARRIAEADPGLASGRARTARHARASRATPGHTQSLSPQPETFNGGGYLPLTSVIWWGLGPDPPPIPEADVHRS